MHIAHLTVAIAVIAYCAFSAVLDFARYQPILVNMTRAGVPHTWLPVLGALKGAGAVGLLAGLIGVPVVGTAAATGIVLFFVGAILTHLRPAGDDAYGLALGFLLPAVAVLALGLAD
ncbi:DoxX family protein [Kitasatospora sp. NBC_00315]|uniref:DoxX family protein n=1 Tax=Kitasatospora sp. NBC_00315 TaxID=2975963 RepID=UPI003246EB19